MMSDRISAPGLQPTPSGTRVQLRVTGCRDDARRATDGLPSAADAPLQRSELAKSATSRHSANTSFVEQAKQLEKG